MEGSEQIGDLGSGVHLSWMAKVIGSPELGLHRLAATQKIESGSEE